ncbi:phage tail tube protein [Acuticoccus sp.]|uniref:phage tail tube protein n=1 Tax=Acuticoccus sp. TaxID=1904378 RepID=UPI003B51FE5C
MALAFESVFGTAPESGFHRMPFASSTIGSEQPLLDSELFGYGRDPLAPVKDAVTADGDVVVPIDAEPWGVWLKSAFGSPTTTGSGPYTHDFRSGSWTLPSMAIETAMPDVPHFAMASAASSIGSAGRCSDRGSSPQRSA